MLRDCRRADALVPSHAAVFGFPRVLVQSIDGDARSYLLTEDLVCHPAVKGTTCCEMEPAKPHRKW